MTGFFDEPSTTGTNRAAPPTDCPTCRGDRLVFVEENEYGSEVYGRCPDCSPVPTDRQPDRHPVPDARWKNYDR